MKWFRIEKDGTKRPSSGTYREWKPVLREEGKKQCVYCALAEARFGGERNFHVEHYRPKKHFVNLIHELSNLFYACSICNSFKGSDWPREPTEDLCEAFYPDPSAVDYSEFLEIQDNYHVTSKVRAGAYLIERIYLNRPQLLLARETDALLQELRQLSERVGLIIRRVHGKKAATAGEALLEVVRILDKLSSTPPYEPADVRR